MPKSFFATCCGCGHAQLVDRSSVTVARLPQCDECGGPLEFAEQAKQELGTIKLAQRHDADVLKKPLPPHDKAIDWDDLSDWLNNSVGAALRSDVKWEPTAEDDDDSGVGQRQRKQSGPMPDIDFVMTYPCYFAFGDEGGSIYITVDGDACLCLFTNADVLQAFYMEKQREKHGPNFVPNELKVTEYRNYEGLMAVLKPAEPELTASGIHYLAIDPSPGKQVGYVRIRDFIEQRSPE